MEISEVMELKLFPKRIYIFDINGTLNFTDLNYSQVPAKTAFDVIKKKEDVWAGVWSGMYCWMQLQYMSQYNIIPDFILMKYEGNSFKKSMEHIYKREFDCDVICVGDQEEDKKWAEYYGFKYLTPKQFTDKLVNAGYLPRLDPPKVDRQRIQRNRRNLARNKR